MVQTVVSRTEVLIKVAVLVCGGPAPLFGDAIQDGKLKVWLKKALRQNGWSSQERNEFPFYVNISVKL